MPGLTPRVTRLVGWGMALGLLARCQSTPSPRESDGSPPEPPPLHQPSLSDNPDLRALEAANAAATMVMEGGGRRTGVRGRCLVALTNQGQISTPCSGVSLLVRDGNGKELHRTVIERGHFRFPLPRVEEFYLVVDSPRFRLKSTGGPFRSTDDPLILELVPVTEP